MKTSLTEIVQQKQETKKQLNSLKSRYLSIIYGGVANQDSVNDIHKKLYSETINQKRLGKATSAKMLNVAFSYAISIKKKTKDIDFVKKQVEAKYGLVDDKIGVILGMFVFELMNRNKVEEKMSKVIRKDADTQEADAKSKALNAILDYNIQESRSEALKNGEISEIDTSKIKIFYLASAHKDSASDHAPYQGKMYVDENWENIPMPYGLHNAIAYYIKSHDVKTIQWVTGKPVWFITRPNCRHYFKEMSVKQVLATSRTKLINKYDMKTAIGDRQYLQTIKSAKDKKQYGEIRNAQLVLEKYEERLALHKEMYSQSKNAIIRKAITKDKMLIDKWKKFIDEKQKEKDN